MPDTSIGRFILSGVELETWLLKFDKAGACVSPQTRKALLARLDAVPDTPVILFSHGWNNEFGDATALYAEFLKQLQSHSKNYADGRKSPLFVGILWPSTWLSFDTGPQIAALDVGAAGVAADDAFVRELANGFPDAATREQFYALLDAPRLAEDDAAKLATLVVQARKAQSADAAADDAEQGSRDGEVILAGMRALRELDKPAADPGAPLGPAGTIGRKGADAPRDAGFLDFLDPRKALRVASVYQMKDRAGTVGWTGVSALVRDILVHSRAPLHLVGHSFGAKVVLSALAAGEIERPVASALLLEPAISYLSFAAQVPGRVGVGGYRDVLRKIGDSIVMTYSKNDFPLHEVFHRALRRSSDIGEAKIAGGPITAAGPPPDEYAALGGYGPRGAGEQLVEPLPEPGTQLAFPNPVAPLAFDGTQFNRINGHGDVATAYTAWLLYTQMAR